MDKLEMPEKEFKEGLKETQEVRDSPIDAIPHNPNLHQAITKVMQEVKNIDKAMTVGSGSYAYKGVADKDVKQLIGQSMADNGLTCLPVNIEPTMRVDRWQDGTKQKQSVFTEVLATYRITHAETGESIEIMGYGHGQDAMDKSAGKATTYALKNALLYTFLVPTGAIDDADSTHSNDKEATPKTLNTVDFDRGLSKMGKEKFKTFCKDFKLTPDQDKQLL